MTFDWREYLKLAQYLQGDSEHSFTKEAASRCAVSRAYYAAFCFARNYARDKQAFVLTGTAQDHALLRKHFQQRKMSEVANQLSELRQWRNFCDYDDTVKNLSMLLESSINEAEKLIKNFSSPSE